MVRRFLHIAAILMAAAAAVSCLNAPEVPELRTGDLVFVGLPMDYSLDNKDDTTMDNAIVAATGGEELNMIHVAIVEVANDTTWIIDATIKHGVDRHPLSVFLSDFTLKTGDYPEFIVKRVKDNSLAQQWVETAKSFCGAPYDVYFNAGDDAYYCSELVETSYLDASGKRIFHNAPMNFKDENGEFPLYWQQLFAMIESEIPQDKPGTNPQAMSKEDCLETVEGIDITVL